MIKIYGVKTRTRGGNLTYEISFPLGFNFYQHMGFKILVLIWTFKLKLGSCELHFLSNDLHERLKFIAGSKDFLYESSYFWTTGSEHC